MQQTKLHNSPMTFDDLSAERSKSFVKALQELKNLRPQLYSAAEYCEKSYLHNEEKQMVLDNLKDYAVRALVNAVDHLGTVAYKLTDLFDEQTLDVSTVEIKISCLNQQLLTSQACTDREGLRQQQLLAFIPRHHKHYIVPNSINKKVHFSPQRQIDARQKHIQMKLRPYPSGSPSSKTLSWHLASETNPVVNGPQSSLSGTENPKASGITSNVFRLLDAEESVPSISSLNHQSTSGSPVSREVIRTFGATRRDSLEASKKISTFRSFDNPGRREISRPPVRSKSMLSAIFGKNKSAKLKTSYAS